MGGGFIMNLKVDGKKVVGAKQTIKMIKGNKTSIVYLAKDAEAKVTKPIEELCIQNNVEYIYIESMKELGQMCGIDVGAATAALID
jgi:large subunit ribosomal protein L7A